MSRRETLPVYIGAALLGLLLSLWQIHSSPQINHDAVYYLQALQGDVTSIKQIGNWLFYPALIKGVSLALSLEPEHAAWLLNILLDTLLVLAFIRLVETLGGNRNTLLWAALLVLSLPYLNDNRAEIIRDHGYWAFTLVAMIAYLRLYRSFSWSSLLLWNLAMFIATLFRVEGAVFLAIMPFGLLLNTRLVWKQRLRLTTLALLPIVTIGLVFALVMAFSASFQNRLVETISQAGSLPTIFTETIPRKAELLQHRVLPQFSQSTAEVTIYLGVIYSIIKDLISSLSWLYFGILVLRRWFPAPGLAKEAPAIIGFYAAISIMILFLHGSQHFVMVSRYTMSLALVLLVVVVFSMEELQRKIRENPALKPRMAVIAICIALLFADSLVSSAKPKVYILDAARWAQENLPDGARVLTDYNAERVGYYSNKNNKKHYLFLRYRPAATPIEDFDYAFVRTRRGKANSKLQQLLYGQGLKPMQKITDEQQGVIVYKLP
ncbi:hypothetical protein [Thiolapillus sp.]